MADERNEDQFGETEGKNANQQPTGQQGQQHQFGQQPTGQQGQQPIAQQGQQAGGLGSDPTMSGQNPGEPGQGSEFGGQSSSGQRLSGQAQSDTDTLTDQGGGAGTTGQSGGFGQGGTGGGSQGEGFIGSQGTGGDESLLERQEGGSASSGDATGGSDFASKGQGATDKKDEDVSGSGSSGL